MKKTVIDLVDSSEPTEKDYGTIITDADVVYVKSNLIPLCNIICEKNDDKEGWGEFMEELNDGKWNGIIVPPEMTEEGYCQKSYAEDMVKLIRVNGNMAEETELYSVLCK